MSLRDVGARLTTVLDLINSARTSLRAAGDRLGDARTMFDETLSGSSSYDVDQVSQRYRSALGGLDDLAAALDAAESAVEAIRERMTADASALGVSAALPDRGRLDTGMPLREPVGATPVDVEQLRGELPPPVEKNKGQKTHGRWVDPTGGVHPIISGNEGMADDALIYFRDRLKSRVIPRVISHVETKLAVHMATNGIRSATLVLNNRPCPGPVGCGALLPVILPPGYTLTVHGPGGFRKEYRGGGSSNWVP